jgi:peptidyl-prolyl cis-trans isomerase C
MKHLCETLVVLVSFGTWAAVGLAQTLPASQPATASASAPPTTQSTDVAATVNGRPISGAEIDKLVWQRTPKEVLENPQAASVVAQQRARYLDTFVENELLDEQVALAGIQISDAEMAQAVEEELQAYLSNYGTTRDEFDSQLRAQRNRPLEQFAAERIADPAQRAALARKQLLEKKDPDVLQVSDEELQQYYENRRDRAYTLPEQVRVRQILISTLNMNPQQKADARKKAEHILAEARPPAADFAALAARYSDCPSKAKGGDLGFSARRGGLAEPLAAAAFALEVGQLSDILETENGYHLLKVTDKAGPRTIPLEEARRGVLQTLREQKVRTELKRYATELRSKADIVYSPGWAPLAPTASTPVPAQPGGAPATSQPAPAPK